MSCPSHAPQNREARIQSQPPDASFCPHAVHYYEHSGCTAREMFLSRPRSCISAALHFTVCSTGVAQNHFGCLNLVASQYQLLISPCPPDPSETHHMGESEEDLLIGTASSSHLRSGGMSFSGYPILSPAPSPENTMTKYTHISFQEGYGNVGGRKGCGNVG